MNQFLKNLVAIVRKTIGSKPAAHPERSTPTPGLGVRTPVKAGAYLQSP
jgi:hypothetical protein